MWTNLHKSTVNEIQNTINKHPASCKLFYWINIYCCPFHFIFNLKKSGSPFRAAISTKWKNMPNFGYFLNFKNYTWKNTKYEEIHSRFHYLLFLYECTFYETLLFYLWELEWTYFIFVILNYSIYIFNIVTQNNIY